MEGRIHLMSLMLLGFTCVNGSLELTTSQLPAVEGKTFSLFCHNNIKATVVRWYRNGVLVVQMNHPSCSMTFGQEFGLNGTIVGNQYTSRRVNASCAHYESSVTLLVDSSQVGSVWWLEDNNNTRSNSVTIEATPIMTSPTSMTSTKATSTPTPKTVPTTSTTAQDTTPNETGATEHARITTYFTSMNLTMATSTATPRTLLTTTFTAGHDTTTGSTDETGATGQVYTVAATTAGIIIIIAMVVLICYFVKHRHTGEKSATNDDGGNTLALPRSSRNVEPSVNATSETVETASYITLDHVDTTDNTYTQFKNGVHSEISEGSVHYNTIPTCGGGHSDISQEIVYYNTVPTGGEGHSDISQEIVYYNTMPTGGGHSDIGEGSVYYNTVPADAAGENPPQTIH